VQARLLVTEKLLKRTVSRCTVCRAPAPGEVWRRSEGKTESIWLRRRCTDHGSVEVCISSDARFYWLAQGDPGNAGCDSAGTGGVSGTLGCNAIRSAANGEESQPSKCESLSTCLALIEIVNSCNLACPTCYADSPLGATGAMLDAVPLADLQRRIQGVINRKGRIEILQLSGGEPTLHPDFFELLAWAQAHPEIEYLLINTNGVRLARDRAFAAQLGRTFRYGGLQIYLQFDGVQEEGQRAMRGMDLRALREQAIAACGEFQLPITLALTVTSENLPHLWRTIEWALRWPHIRGIAFQPEFEGKGAGRKAKGEERSAGEHFPARLTTADVILACLEESKGRLKIEDFTPLPCGDPNCATIGYLLKTPAGIRSISDFVDFEQVHGFLRDRVRYSLEDLARCGCESEPLGRLLHDFELNETSTFRLFIKPFMDAWTWDEDRIDRCCTHVIRPDGELDSFCRYYSGFAGTGTA
jgi:uncharacterized radical SAM superfamily Fe-S cluster-containing enzyme